METPSTETSPVLKKEKPKTSKAKSSMKKLDPESIKLLSQLKEKANKKDFGRKIREKDILSVALKLVKEEDLKALQEQSYTEKDRLHLAHEDYVKKNGRITLEQFIGLLLRGEVQVSVQK